MVPLRSWNFLSGILSTQCGDALAHGQEDRRHRIRSDRFAGAGIDSSAQSDGVDEEVAELGLIVPDVTEGAGLVLAVLKAEVAPILEVGKSPGSSFGDESGVCGLQSKAEVSLEAISGRSVCAVQGFGSG
jgi:hypothetical protein